MGTANSGGSGSGSGTRAGGGGNGGGGGSYASSGGEMINKPYDEKVISDEVTAVFKALFSRALSYTKEMFDNAYLNSVYLELFTLASLIHNQSPEEAIASRYKLDMNEPGFILNLISQLHEKFSATETDARCIEAARNALEKFLFRAVDNEPDLLIDGTGREVVVAMKNNETFWKSIAGYFLWYLSTAVYRKETEIKTPKATYAVEKEIERRTNRLLDSYKERSNGQKVNYKELFKYISQNWDWFKEEVTK